MLGFDSPCPLQTATTANTSVLAVGRFVRAGGIEPPTTAWKAVVLPLNYARAMQAILAR